MRRLPGLLLALAVLAGARTMADDGVILLHGLCRTSAAMRKMETALTQAGYRVLNVNYPSRTASVGELSEDVIGTALRSERLAGCGQVHFVTHSLGGILVRVYFARHGVERPGRVVMLGPPNQGSEVVDHLKDWTAFQKLNGPAGSELGTDAASGPKALGPVEFELGVIAGDRSINWINSRMIPGRDDGKVSVDATKVQGMKEHLVVHATHPYLMKHDEAIAATIRFLKHGTFKSSGSSLTTKHAKSAK